MINKVVVDRFMNGFYSKIANEDVPKDGFTSVTNVELTQYGTAKRLGGFKRIEKSGQTNELTAVFRRNDTDIVITDGSTFWTVTD